MLALLRIFEHEVDVHHIAGLYKYAARINVSGGCAGLYRALEILQCAVLAHLDKQLVVARAARHVGCDGELARLGCYVAVPAVEGLLRQRHAHRVVSCCGNCYLNGVVG